MDRDVFQRMAAIFDAARRVDPASRSDLLDRECWTDPTLRAEVELLLRRHDDAVGIFADDDIDGGLRIDVAGVEGLLLPGAAEDLSGAIGSYRIVRKLGEGGMGTVYEAEQEQPRRRVALKVLRPGLASERLVRRFELESEMLGRLQHSGIAQVYEAGIAETGGGPVPFFAMELVDGKPLIEHAEDSACSIAERIELLARICDAVEHAHQRGVIHRDLKPENILVGAGRQPHVLDFGVARAIDTEARVTMQTSIGELVGTVAYMSPEQASGAGHELDTRSDLYSVGVVGYELLTGRLPYDLESKSVPSALSVICREEPRSPSTHDRRLAGDIGVVILKALEKEKERRYGSAAAFASDLRRVLRREPVDARAPTIAYRLVKFTRRNKLLVSAAVAVAGVLVLATAVSTRLAIDATTEAKKATEVVELVRSMFESANPKNLKGLDYTVRELLDDFSAGLGDRLPVEADVEATLHATVAAAYRGLGDYETARAHCERAVALFTEALGEDHYLTLRTLNDLGISLKQARRYREAERVYRVVVERQLRKAGGEDLETLKTRNNLASVELARGHGAQAEPILREIRELAERQGIEDVRFRDVVTSNLASAYFDQDRSDDAERVWLEVLESRRTYLPGGHPELLATLCNLGFLYLKTDAAAKAEPFFREALESQSRVLPPSSEQALRAVQGLGDAYYRIGRWADAAPLLRRWCSAPGPHHGDPSYHRYVFWLGESLRETGEYAEARRYLEQSFAYAVDHDGAKSPRAETAREALRKLFAATGEPELAAALEPVVPETPDAVRPRPGASLPDLVPRLEASPFRSSLRGVEHRKTHWLLRDERASYESEPSLEAVDVEGATEFRIPRGLLLPATRYFWKVRYIGSNHVASEFSAESVFTTPVRPLAFTRLRLDELFNADVVRDPGDDDNDSFDADAGGLFTVDGFDGRRTDNPEARGLPRDRVAGVHRLGDYALANSREFHAAARPATIAAGASRATAIRFLVAGGNGDSLLDVRLEFAGGTVERRVLPCPDWFDDASPSRDGVAATPIRNGMDRFRAGDFHEAGDPALFEVLLPADSDRVLSSIVIDPAASTFESPRTRAHLFAVTLVFEGP